MVDVRKATFVRSCIRENILPLMRLDQSAIDSLDAVVLKAVECIELERYTTISPTGVAQQISDQMERSAYRAPFEFYRETSKWKRLNYFGVQRPPEGAGMVPVIVYGTNHFVIAELVREALRCYDVLHPEEGSE